MSGVRDHHIANGTIKLTNTYSNDFDKAIQQLQLAVIQRREKIDRGIRTTTAYTLNEFRRACNDDLADLPALNRKNLQEVELMI